MKKNNVSKWFSYGRMVEETRLGQTAGKLGKSSGAGVMLLGRHTTAYTQNCMQQHRERQMGWCRCS